MRITTKLACAALLTLPACSNPSHDGDVRAAPVPATSAASGVADPQPQPSTLDFEQERTGVPPLGWKAEGTNRVAHGATWAVIEDPTAPSKPKVLALIKPDPDAGGAFNVCWTNALQFHDGRLEVSFKANAGDEDQGGGPIWRVQDKDNYYVCRANPLENNFRLYYVKAGSRVQLASANVECATGTWHTIAVEQLGKHITCALDGQALLEAVDDTFPGAGGVGCWTKSDAASSFDDLRLTSRAPVERGK